MSFEEKRISWPDGKRRCSWCNPKNRLYIAYHDTEWGHHCHDDKRLFEMLILEGFQAGLSWECVLNKRDAFRKAFDGFNIDAICQYDEEKFIELQQNPGIIRNRLKIRASRTNAIIFRNIQEEYGSFDAYIWHWSDGNVVYECGMTQSALSNAISKDLKKRGMKFVGTTIIYAYLQAIGIVCSHEKDCFLFERSE